MLNKTNVLLLLSLTGWIVFYYFFVDTIPQFYGVAVLIFQIVFLLCLYLIKEDTTQVLPKEIVFASVTIVLWIRLSIYTQATMYPINLFLLVVFNWLLFSEQSNTYTPYVYWFGTVLRARLSFIWSLITWLWKYFNEIFIYIWGLFHIPKQKNDLIKEILIGVWILICVLFVIIPLLTSADLWFSALVDWVLWWLNPKTLISYLWSNSWEVIGVVLSVLFWYGILRHYTSKKTDAVLVKRKEIIISQLRSKIIFYGLNFVYLVFVLVQFRFLFFGTHEAIVGRWFDSYASYIHRWFWQLIIVACINVWVYSIFESHGNKKRWILSLITLCACTWIIILSALLRTSAYIQAYWLTFLRSVVILICLWFIIMYGYMVVRVYIQQKYSLVSILLSIFWIVRIIFWFLNIDTTIAKYNINAYTSLPSDYEENWQEYWIYKKSTVLDINYLYSLSADAVEVLTNAYEQWTFLYQGEYTWSNSRKFVQWKYLERYSYDSQRYHWNYFSIVAINKNTTQ